MQKTYQRIVFTGVEQAELKSVEMPSPSSDNWVLAKTLYSWVSAGTETTGLYCGTLTGMGYPACPGYSSVSKVVEVGSEVKELQVGDLVLGGGHGSWQCLPETHLNRVHPDIDPLNAAFIHMFKIPLPALTRARVRGPEKCVIAGLGLVGLCAAQLAQMLGYDVYAYDVNPQRRQIAERYHLKTTTGINEKIFGKTVGLGVDCSGNEQAVLELSRVIRRFGELTLVGVPWKPHGDLHAQTLLHSVFYNYLTISSGWELDMPDHKELYNNRTFELETMRGMQHGFLKILPDDYEIVSPEDPQLLYQNLLHQRQQGLGYMLDWRHLD